MELNGSKHLYIEARNYARIGAPIGPAEGKAIKVPNWSNLSIEELLGEKNHWFWKRATGIGLLCGERSGIICLDIDLDLVTDAKLISLIESRLPPIFSGKIGNPKRRPAQFFRFNGEVNRKFKNISVEILSTGNQTILPPSAHPAGGNYIWKGRPLVGLSDLDELPDLPTGLLDWLEELDRGQGVNGDSDEKASGRNNKLLSLCAAKYAAGIAIERAADEVFEFDLKHHSPPLFSDAKEMAGKGGNPRANALKFVTSVYLSFMKKGIGPDVAADSKNIGNSKNSAERKLVITGFSELHPNESGGNLIDGLIDVNNLSCLYGESNVGKSFIGIDAALHIALGRPWFGRTVTSGGAIYLAAEAGPSIALRTEAFKVCHGLRDRTDIPFGAILSSIDMYDREADTALIISAIAEWVAIHGSVSFIVIDTLAKAIAGANENAAQDMNAFIYNVERLRTATGAHIMIVHHSGKDTAKGARGHSSLRAAMDTEIEVFAGGFRVKKQRSVQIPSEAIGFKLEEIVIGKRKDGTDQTSCVVVPREFVNNEKRRNKSSERALQLLECLRHLIETESTAPQVKTKSPAGVKVGLVFRLKTIFCERHLLGCPKNTLNTTFRRAAEELQGMGKMGIDGELCWLIPERKKHGGIDQ